ncbi:hypothetical protein ACWDAO_14810 [Streptomyces sp. NPDC001212]
MTQTQALELSEAQQALDAAQRDKAQLDERIEALEERVREGNEQSAIEELGRQWAARRRVELRQEAAEQMVREAEAAELAQKRREAEAAAQADLDELGVPVLAEAFEDAVRALDRLQQLGDARQAAIERHAKVFVDLEMTGPIVHREGDWTVYEVAGSRFDTSQDRCSGSALLELLDAERARRAQIPARVARGFAPPEVLPHPVTLHIDEQQAEASK